MKKGPRKQGAIADSARKFVVSELIKVPLAREKAGRHIDTKQIHPLLEKCAAFAKKHGCYVFAIRTSQGATPVYVGRATKQTLGKEAFSADKLNKANCALQQWKKGTLVLAFVTPEDDRRNVAEKSIKEIEDVLIQYAHERNPNVQNERGIIKYRWFIDGVFNSNPGRPAEKCNRFRAMLGID